MTTNMREKDTVQDWKPLLEQHPERVKKREKTDQRIHSANSSAASENPTVKLPLFMDTLFKAKDFDPL
jgi:cytochrome c-type biogenesis protein CcmH/NrfG